jgi:hypothetical protein
MEQTQTMTLILEIAPLLESKNQPTWVYHPSQQQQWRQWG